MTASRPTSRSGLVFVRLSGMALVVAVVAGGCAFRTAREAKKAAAIGFIGGSVNATGGTSGTYVLLYAIGKDGKILIDGIAELSDLTATWWGSSCRWPRPFSFRRGNNPLFPMSSDSVVPVESQLPMWAQRDAFRTWGFDSEHVGILTEEAPVTTVLDILNRVAAGRR